MNLIRLLKLKKLNGELDNLSNDERYFLSFFYDISTNIKVSRTVDFGTTIFVNELLYLDVYTSPMLGKLLWISNNCYCDMYNNFKYDRFKTKKLVKDLFKKLSIDSIKIL